MICLQACLISEEVIFSCCWVLFISSVKIYGISSIILGKFMACFSIISMEKQAMNFPKLCTMCDHAVKSELSRIMIQVK